MNYYQHHIGDFIRDTSRLSNDQCMAYLRLLWLYYETEEPLSGDVDAIAFRIGANACDVKQILKHFFFEHEGMWHQARCDKEILAFRNKSDKAKKSAEARWNNAKAMRTHTERNANVPVSDANQEPVTSNQSKPKSRATATRLPSDWVLSHEDYQFCEKERPDLKPETVADQFRDYWIAQPGAKGRKLDWPATWRNWVRNQRQDRQPQNFIEDRKQTLDFLTGAGKNVQPNEHDITGESTRIA